MIRITLKQIRYSESTYKYQVLKIVNSIEYPVGGYLTPQVVQSLCKNNKWSVTIT